MIEERERLGLTQGNISDALGINRKTQFAYERDHRYPDAGYLISLSDHGFDVSYLLSGKRAPQFGAVHEQLLTDVLVTVDLELTRVSKSLDPGRKAKLVALVYRTASETGLVDPVVAQKAIDLIT